jgi:hypothetical protein
MTNRRAKIAAGATVVGLAALGGAALGSNPGMQASQSVASSGHAAVVTTASGATVPASQTVALKSEVRPPIVTRASGGGLGVLPEDD